MLDPSVEAGIRERLRVSTFAKWMGIELVSLDDGASELQLTIEEHHLNPGGIAHGGIIATLADAAIGVALRTKLGADATHVTVHLDVSYVRPIREGTMTARGRAVHSGERIGFGDADLSDGEGRLVARAGATFLVVPARPDA